MENQNTPPVPQAIQIDPVFAAFSVLVVDDSRTLRKILIRELNSLGFHNILEAADGLEAIEVVKTKAVDLMLLDMEMPELDGLGVLGQLKADDTYKSLPIIVISGADQFEKTIKCIEIGAEDYLPKPFSFACPYFFFFRKKAAS
jgi:adenylate cyclase